MKQILPTLICLGLAAAFASAQTSFYTNPPLFSYSPVETKSLTTIKHLGAVGMGIDLIQPAFRMQIHLIEDGSPAAATGKLKAGQMIESINGQTLKDIDPRIQLGQIIEKAEASDGIPYTIWRSNDLTVGSWQARHTHGPPHSQPSTGVKTSARIDRSSIESEAAPPRTEFYPRT